MSNLRRIVLGIGLLGLMAGCELGGAGEGGGSDVPERIPSDEPGQDDRLDALGIICESTLLVSGTFEETMAQPPDRMGCWEVGIWTVNMVSVDFEGCDPQPQIDTTFTYEVTFDEETAGTEIRYLDDPEYERLNLKITTAGDGLCHASFEHFGTDIFPDNVLLTLQPTLMEDGTISGIGAYAYYEEDPF